VRIRHQRRRRKRVRLELQFQMLPDVGWPYRLIEQEAEYDG
jgi:hypothetical protein